MNAPEEIVQNSDGTSDATPPPPASSHLEPESPTSAAAIQALNSGAAALTFYESGVIGGEVEPIHQFRVNIRRLRAAVELFASTLYALDVQYLKGELAQIGRVAGAVRDCDVLANVIRDEGRKLDKLAQPGLAAITDAIAQERSAALQDLALALRGKRYARLMIKLVNPRIRKDGSELPIAHMAPAMMRPLLRKTDRAAAALSRDTPATFHKLRVRIKRVRYALDMLDKLAPKPIAKTIKGIKRLQEDLGRNQDFVHAAQWLRDYAQRPQVPAEALLTVGALMQVVTERQENLTQKALRRWRKTHRRGRIPKAYDAIVSVSRESLNTDSRPHIQS